VFVVEPIAIIHCEDGLLVMIKLNEFVEPLTLPILPKRYMNMKQGGVLDIKGNPWSSVSFATQLGDLIVTSFGGDKDFITNIFHLSDDEDPLSLITPNIKSGFYSSMMLCIQVEHHGKTFLQVHLMDRSFTLAADYNATVLDFGVYLEVEREYDDPEDMRTQTNTVYLTK